jgi:predicted DNA-binding transcriptional regulator AlpA
MKPRLTIEACADILGVSTKWLYETAIPHLAFPARVLGIRNLRVDPDELEKWWNSQPLSGRNMTPRARQTRS